MPSPLSSYSVTTDTTFSSTSDADLRQGGINSQLHRGRASFASHVERGRPTNESLSLEAIRGDHAGPDHRPSVNWAVKMTANVAVTCDLCGKARMPNHVHNGIKSPTRKYRVNSILRHKVREKP